MASARAVALAIFWARHKTDPQTIAKRLTERFGHDLSTTPDTTPDTTSDTTAATTVPTTSPAP